MATDKKNVDALPESRSERALPLNVETVLFEGARKAKTNYPDDERVKLIDNGSDLETIREDIEPEETVPTPPLQVGR